MSKASKNVKVMIPRFWELFVRYLNYQNYFVKSEDVLSELFMRGETDAKEFIEKCNSFAEENGLTVRFQYKKKLTYSNLLNQLNNEQNQIHKSKGCKKPE